MCDLDKLPFEVYNDNLVISGRNIKYMTNFIMCDKIRHRNLMIKIDKSPCRRFFEVDM